MAKKFDISVIGAGLIGLSTADHLERAGYVVTVYDAASGPGAGASYCNSGMIHPSQARPWLVSDAALERMSDVHRLAKRSAALLKTRMTELGMSDSHRPDGCLQLFDSPVSREQAEHDFEKLGVQADRYRGRWDLTGHTLNFPEDSSGNPYTYCHALFDDLLSRGVTFRFDQEVRLTTDDGRIAVVAKEHTHRPDHVVLAAGAQSKMLVQPIGFDIPVTPVRGYALNFTKPDTALPEVPVMHAESRSALTVFDNHVRLSGTVGEKRPDALLKIWSQIAPEIVKEFGAPTLEWHGDRPTSDLGRPIIGPSPIEGLWINTGHGHMGWTLCAGSAEHLAGLIEGEIGNNPFALP